MPKTMCRNCTTRQKARCMITVFKYVETINDFGKLQGEICEI